MYLILLSFNMLRAPYSYSCSVLKQCFSFFLWLSLTLGKFSISFIVDWKATTHIGKAVSALLC